MLTQPSYNEFNPVKKINEGMQCTFCHIVIRIHRNYFTSSKIDDFNS